MKGDFSFLALPTEPHYSGVLHQQGRVLLDRDWNEAAAIAATWRDAFGRDTFGGGILAVPVADAGAFKVLSATSDGSTVQIGLDAGRAWADGLSLTLDAPATFTATYFAPPFQAPQASPSTIADGVRDLVVLEAWEDSVSGFQDPLDLIEPALGGPDTTERVQAFATLKLLRLGPNDDCGAAALLGDDLDARAHLTVSPAPVLMITGDCPVDAGGGYTGLEHYLYRIEVADADAAGNARFKWSQWNGGLVGRGLYAAGVPGAGTVTITANDQMINHCGVTDFWLEASAFDATLGAWRITLTADATLSQDGILSLVNVQGAWPSTTPSSAFFRLWNGIAAVADYPVGGVNPVELKDGIRLEFDPASADNANYQAGDYWTFPVRASGVAFDPPIWPADAPPQGIVHSRVALGILNWNGAPTVSITSEAGQIGDCRRVFRPLTNQKICCTFNVGDGRTSHGDFDSIEQALQNMPSRGGEICLLPGVHTTNAQLTDLANIVIKGCDTQTKLLPRPETPTAPLFTLTDCTNIRLEHMDMATLAGAAIVVSASKPGGTTDVEICHNRVLAFTNAISARNVDGVNIHHNHIRMLDKRGANVAIYLAGDDSLIERNDIRLVPAWLLPPIIVPTVPDPVDPNDPCADLGPIWINPRLFATWIDSVWFIVLPGLFLLPQPYRALGGIQLGGGCERVTVLENLIVGGAGNGVTLGGSITVAPPPPPPPDQTFTVPTQAGVIGRVLGPDGKPAANVQITLTDVATGQVQTWVTDDAGQFRFGSNAQTWRVSEGVPGESIDTLDFEQIPGAVQYALTITLKTDETPIPDDSGFLYDITLERNSIEAMGLSGIGIPAPVVAQTGAASLSAVAAATNVLGTVVIRLAIRGNRIIGCLVDSFDVALIATAQDQGLGGVSLGVCEALTIVDNQIERNGLSGANPVCGVYVKFGVDVEVSRNRIVDNGPLTPDITSKSLVAGVRGGLVLLVTNVDLLATQGVALGETFSQRPAARVQNNLVDQPVGLALYMVALGPVQCTDNAFASDMSGINPFDTLVGTVFLLDLGGVQQTAAGMQLQRASPAVAAPAPAAATGAKEAAAATSSDAQRVSPVAMLAPRAADVDTLLPSGNVLFADNQSRTGQANTSPVCHWIITSDDLCYQGNQCYSVGLANLVSNVSLRASTLRATGNRLRERSSETMLSLYTLAEQMNDTSFNQGDHCIVAVGQNTSIPEVKIGNQVLFPNALCGGRGEVASLLFKSRE